MIDPGEPERPWQPDDDAGRASRPTGIAGVVAAVLLVALLLCLRYGGPIGWVLCAGGLSFGYAVVRDVLRGRTSVSRYSDPRDDYVRSADPVGFWVVIGIKGAAAAAAIVYGVGLSAHAWHG